MNVSYTLYLRGIICVTVLQGHIIISTKLKLVRSWSYNSQMCHNSISNAYSIIIVKHLYKYAVNCTQKTPCKYRPVFALYLYCIESNRVNTVQKWVRIYTAFFLCWIMNFNIIIIIQWNLQTHNLLLHFPLESPTASWSHNNNYEPYACTWVTWSCDL